MQGVLKEKQKNKPAAQPVGSLIDALINEEIVRFTSLDGINDPSGVGKSASPTDDGNAPLDPGSFVDTRGWADESQHRQHPQRPGGQAQPQGLLGGGHRRPGRSAGGRRRASRPSPPSVPRNPAGTAPRSRARAPVQRRRRPGKLILLVVTVLLALAGAGVAAWFLTKH